MVALPAREEPLLQAIDVVSAGGSVDITGDYGSGRTDLLGRLQEHFDSRGWKVLRLSGTTPLRKTPMSALSWLGINAASGATAISDIKKMLAGGRGAVIIVDDGEDVDDISWGVLARVAVDTQTPVVAARLYGSGRHHHSGTSDFMDAYRIHLGPLLMGELETTLVQVTGVAFEPATLSNIFALTAGNIGLALAVFRSARQSGRLQVDEGVATATGSLWSPALSPIAEAIIQPLTPEQKNGIESMAILGPAPMKVALKVIPRPVLEELGDRAMLDLYHASDVHVVAVRQPFLASYYRNQSHNIRRMLVNDDVTGGLDEHTIPLKPVPTQEQSAVFAMLVNEHERRCVYMTREAWEESRTKGTAAAHLQAMTRVGGFEGAIARVKRESADLSDSLEGTLAWEGWYGGYLAYARQDRNASILYLRERAKAQPHLAPWLLSWELVLRPGFEVGGGYNTLPDEEGQPPEAIWEMRRARTFELLVTGKVDEAMELIEPLRTERTDLPLDVMTGVACIATGDFERAADIAREGLRSVTSDFDSGGMVGYAYLGALTGILSGRMGDAEEAVTKVVHLGVPPDGVFYHLAVSALTAAIAAKRGGIHAEPTTTDPLASRGSLPSMQMEWVEVERLKGAGRTEDAGELLLTLGDELWSRGLRLAAAYCYIIGGEVHPHEMFIEPLTQRVTQVSGHAVDLRRRFSLAGIRADVDELCHVAVELEESGLVALSLKTWNHVLAHSQRTGNIEAESKATDRIERASSLVHENAGLRAAKSVSTLTHREREVARLAATGLSNPEIAHVLFITTRTVESHVLRAMRKTGASTRRDLREFFRPAQ